MSPPSWEFGVGSLGRLPHCCHQRNWRHFIPPETPRITQAKKGMLPFKDRSFKYPINERLMTLKPCDLMIFSKFLGFELIFYRNNHFKFIEKDSENVVGNDPF